MQCLKLLSFTYLLALTAAHNFTTWHPSTYGDSRGPCPALNSLANHYILPHDGRAINASLAVSVLESVFNISPELANIVVAAAINTSSNPSTGTFDLSDLNKHNVIEHDGSLSRADFNEGGDDHTFRPDIWKTVLAWFTTPEITIEQAARARYARENAERKSDDKFVFTENSRLNSFLETAQYSMAMVDAETGATRLDYVKILFEQERLPYNEGWRVPTLQSNGLTLTNVVLQLALATPGNHTDAQRQAGLASAPCSQLQVLIR